MRALVRLGLFAAFATLSSCASPCETEPAAIVWCARGADCDRKWARASIWVSENAFYEIRVQTDWIIQTFGPVGKSKGTAITVYKVATPDGAEIVAYISCANWVRCTPSISDLGKSFYDYVGRSSPLIVEMPSPPHPARGLPVLGDPLALFR